MGADSAGKSGQSASTSIGPDTAVAGAILTIDLAAIRENYRRLKARLGGKACAAVVKANGYGLGAAEVSKALMEEGCDTFFVAHLSEGLRSAPRHRRQPRRSMS